MVNACATSRTVPASIPRSVTGFFSDIFPSDRTMALGSTQPLVKMSTTIIPGGKGGRCVRPTTSPPSRAECHEIWEPKPPGALWVKPGLLRESFTFTFINFNHFKFLNVNLRTLQLVHRACRNLCETAMNSLKKLLHPYYYISGGNGCQYNPSIPAFQISKSCLQIFGENP